MGPFTLEAWRKGSPETRTILAGAQHVFAPEKVLCKIREILNQIPREAPVFWEFSMPAPVVVVEREDGAVLFKDEGETVLMQVLSRPDGRVRLYKRTGKIQFSAWFGAVDDPNEGVAGAFTSLAAVSDILFSLMANPRLMEKRPCSRQQCRAASRATGLRMPAGFYAELKWTVGETTAAKDADDSTDIRKPLHFSRAHWRRAAAHHGKWVDRLGYDGRWQWVSHAWKGHPDFGICLHHYFPDLDLDGASADVVAAVQAAATQQAAAAAVAQWQGQ